MRISIAIAFACLSFLSLYCSSSRTCTHETEFTVDFYSGGGFTGLMNGSTISCDGIVKRWTSSPAAPRVITDSLHLGSKDLALIRSLMQAGDIYTYKKSDIGDYTTYLVLIGTGKTNTISYIGNDIPVDAPKNLVDLITVLKGIQR